MTAAEGRTQGSAAFHPKAVTPGRNLVLIGLMGAGKTSVGRIVARMLDRPFVDTDVEVERTAGQTIAEIFATDGEQAFRHREAEAIRDATTLRGQVIAVGGGAVLDHGNVTALRGTGDLVWLDAPIEATVQHLSAGGGVATRPLLADADELARTLRRLRAERDGAYREAATHTIDTEGRHPAALADEVLTWARTVPGLLAEEERP